MNSVSEYLKDNPDYYIDGGEEILINREIINQNIEKILDKFNFIESIKLLNKNGELLFTDKSSGLEIGRNLYINDSKYWFLYSSRLADGFNKHEGYGKTLYILTAIEALKNNKVFASDISRSISKDAKYAWNSLVNLGLVEFDENLRRFKFINEMLEDYFLE